MSEAGLIPTLNSGCVACGAGNPHGLKLQFSQGSEGAYARWIPATFSESFKGTIHGGIIATVLDEAMSKAIIARDWSAVTAALRLRYRNRISPGDELAVRGWIVDRKKRLITAEATISSADGEELAHAWGTFLLSKRS